jgi:outer membrane receptor protein involved in Fe transport
VTTKTAKAQLLRSTLLAALSVTPGFVSSAFAQDQTAPAPQAAGGGGEVVVVTGSRIARQDYVANSPIVTVDQEDILASGVTTIDTLLNTMPQFVPGINMTSNNPSNGGQSNLQLRGLGANRTLVLMNGRRIVPSTSVGSVDVNILPSQLIASVETITGGASATYGSDAMAGVINFLLRDDFEGLEITAQAGVTDRDDGNTEAVSIAIGGDFGGGNGHAMLMLSYNRRDDIYNGTRDFSKISGPSAASPLGSTIFDTGNLPTPGAISTARPGAVNTNTFGFNDNGSLFSYINRNGFMSPGGIDWDGFGQPGPTFNPDFAYNTGALNYLTLPQTRYNAFASAEYAINDHVEVYTDFLFTQYESAQELAASPAAGSTTGFRVPVSNPYISPALATVLASRSDPLGSFLLDKRFSALGPRRGAELYDVYQITTGVRGDLGFGDWTYDAYASLGRVDRTTIQTGNVSRSAVQRLLNATDGGNSLCAGGFDWYGLTTLSDACKAFIGRTAKNLGVSEQRNVEISAQGGAFELPAGEVRVAAGVSYREDTFDFIPDGSLTGPITTQPCIATAAYSGAGPALAQTACATATTVTPAVPNQPGLTGNDIAGFNPSGALTGATDVTEGFVEVLVPIVKDLPFAQEVNLTFAARTADYSTVGGVDAYKVDVDWTIVDSLRLRGGYQQAVRAPSIGELFAPVLLGFPNIGQPIASGAPAFSGDPCDIRSKYRSTSGTNLAASTNAQVRALCITQGVSAGSVDTYTFTNQQVPGFSGGNANLTEESSDSYTVGLIWEPSFENPWLANLSASIDYYSAELEDAVGSVSATIMLQQCFNANGVSNPTYSPSNVFCQLFSRNPLNGNVINAISTNQNLAAAKTSGVDFQVDWAMDLAGGTLDAGIVGTWLEKFDQQLLPGNPFQQLAGTIGNTGALGSAVAVAQPEWKWMFSTNYRFGPWRVGARWQHIGEMVNRNAPADQIPATGYLDLLGSWNINDNLTLRLNVNNVMDEQPPTYAPSLSANTDPGTYDVLGRRYTIGITARY